MRRPRGPGIRIATLMLVIGLLAGLFWVFRFAPGLGFFLIVPMSVASVVAVVRSRRASEVPMTDLEFLSVFLGAFGLTVSVIAASAIAFFISCLAVLSATAGNRVVYEGNFGLALIFGGIAGLITMVGFTVALLKSHAEQGPRRSGRK